MGTKPIVQPTCPECATTLGPQEGSHRYCWGCDCLIYEDRFVWPEPDPEPDEFTPTAVAKNRRINE